MATKYLSKNAIISVRDLIFMTSFKKVSIIANLLSWDIYMYLVLKGMLLRAQVQP